MFFLHFATLWDVLGWLQESVTDRRTDGDGPLEVPDCLVMVRCVSRTW